MNAKTMYMAFVGINFACAILNIGMYFSYGGTSSLIVGLFNAGVGWWMYKRSKLL